jgi:hypothetical protein
MERAFMLVIVSVNFMFVQMKLSDIANELHAIRIRLPSK